METTAKKGLGAKFAEAVKKAEGKTPNDLARAVEHILVGGSESTARKMVGLTDRIDHITESAPPAGATKVYRKARDIAKDKAKLTKAAKKIQTIKTVTKKAVKPAATKPVEEKAEASAKLPTPEPEKAPLGQGPGVAVAWDPKWDALDGRSLTIHLSKAYPAGTLIETNLDGRRVCMVLRSESGKLVIETPPRRLKGFAGVIPALHRIEREKVISVLSIGSGELPEVPPETKPEQPKPEKAAKKPKPVKEPKPKVERGVPWNEGSQLHTKLLDILKAAPEPMKVSALEKAIVDSGFMKDIYQPSRTIRKCLNSMPAQFVKGEKGWALKK